MWLTTRHTKFIPCLNRWVHSLWQLNVPSGDFSYHSIPDNSIDWIINSNDYEDNVVIPPCLSWTPYLRYMGGNFTHFHILISPNKGHDLLKFNVNIRLI